MKEAHPFGDVYKRGPISAIEEKNGALRVPTIRVEQVFKAWIATGVPNLHCRRCTGHCKQRANCQNFDLKSENARARHSLSLLVAFDCAYANVDTERRFVSVSVKLIVHQALAKRRFARIRLAQQNDLEFVRRRAECWRTTARRSKNIAM